MPFYVFKIILVGPGGVGKTSLLHRFVDNKFSLRYKLTIGVDFISKVIQVNGDSVKLQIWDIGGQERYKFLRPSFFNGANGALMVFDLSRRHTFEELEEWISDIHKYVGNKIPYILIGNKLDLVDGNCEPYEREKAKVHAKTEKTTYVKTSAKTGENVGEAFIDLASKMISNTISK